MLIKPETGETGHTCKPSQLSTSAIMHSYSLKEADIEKHMMSAATRQCEEINLMIQNSFHDVVDAESPPLLSSGSSEETLYLMEAKYDSTTAVESKRQHVGIQNFSASKGGLHEDGKSSAFRSLITELSDTSFKPLIAKSSNSGTKKQEFSTAVKQKRRRMEGNSIISMIVIHTSKFITIRENNELKNFFSQMEKKMRKTENEEVLRQEQEERQQ